MNEIPDHYCHGPIIRKEYGEIYIDIWMKCERCGNEWVASQVNIHAVQKLKFNKEKQMPDETEPLHPAVQDILKYFKYKHLPPNLQAISKPICELAETMSLVGSGAELTAGLRKLLEAKDCFVRSCIK